MAQERLGLRSWSGTIRDPTVAHAELSVTSMRRNHEAGRGDRPGPVALQMLMEIQAGDVLRGRYEIQRLLRLAPDKGIYLAHDRVLDHPVVVDVFSNNSIMP